MIGDTLRAERERQKLTIQDVEKETSIRALYLESLETGDYEKLPGTVYVKGFIKNYAEFLDLDGAALVREYLSEISGAPPVAEKPAENPKPAEKIPETEKIPQAEKISKTEKSSAPVPSRSKRQADSNTGDKSGSKMFLVAAAVVLVFVVAGFLFHNQNSEDVAKVNGEQTQQTQSAQNPNSQQIAQAVNVGDNPAPESVAQPAENVTPPTEQQPAAAPASASNDVSVQGKFNDDCWTRVTADGAVVYEGTAVAGQVLDWKGNEKVSVLVGNAGAVEFVANGENVGHPGANGEVIEKTFTR